MRILTNSQFDEKGLISIVEADENRPQSVIFCVPIATVEAERMVSLSDFERYFSKGITTKIIDKEKTITISMDYSFPTHAEERVRNLPKFVAHIKGISVDFFLSPVNLMPKSQWHLDIKFVYVGDYLKDKLSGQKLIILEPNWKHLDRLFLEKKVVFTDWN